MSRLRATVRGRSAAAGALALSLLVLSAARPAEGQSWFESYDRAEEALQKENWSEAIRHLNQALEQKPVSSVQARTYGMRFISYFPFFKLGIAYHQLGQVEAALQAFETEERQGEIQKSEKDYQKLQSLRNGILDARAQTEAERARRAQEVVAEALRRAQRLEEDGRFDDALAAVAKALAVSPDLEAAQAARRRLLASLADQQRERELDEQIGRLVERGRAALAAGDFRGAATSLSHAQELGPEPRQDVQTLLEQAQSGIRAEIEARQTAEERRRHVTESLAWADRLEASGDRLGALRELQEVLALEPGNVGARDRQERIIQAQATADERERQATSVRALLSEAEQLLASGDVDQALRRANRVLALEPSNETALIYITRAYARLSDSLLATDNAPPAILLNDLREDSPDGVRVEVIRSPEFLLTGTVYDGTPVKVTVLDEASVEYPVILLRREFQGVWINDFRFRHRISKGAVTTFRVVAADDAGETTTETYAVRYAVPFFRSWRFAAAVAGTLISGVLAAVGLRARRRRRLLRNRFNPYIAGAPILEQRRFFGRQSLQDYVLRRIHNNSILLYGERRIGKTSFQHQLKKCLAALDDPDREFFPVYIDLQGTPEERFFATMAAELFDELGPRLDGLEPSISIHDESYGHRAFVQDLHGVIKKLKASSKKDVKLVLLIDEVDELNDYDPRVNQKLRSLFMRTFADSLVSVVSGVAIKKHWEREGSPWYNFFQEIEVKPLDPEEASALIEAPVRGVFTFGEGVVEEILRRTDCKPYLIQRICSALVDRLHEEQRQSFTMADLELVCQAEGH